MLTNFLFGKGPLKVFWNQYFIFFYYQYFKKLKFAWYLKSLYQNVPNQYRYFPFTSVRFCDKVILFLTALSL